VQNEITWQLVSRTGKAHEHLKASGLVEREAGVTPKILTYHIAYVTARHRALTLPSMKAQNSSLRALRPWQTGVATTLCSLVNNVSNASNQQLGPNRQEVQFSEFIQTRFATYMQSIP